MGKLRMLSLFAGIGGLDLGAQWTDGIETVGFVEWDPFCREVLKKHWPDVPQFGDIHDVTARTLADAGITAIDILAGGFPCQGNSLAGQRRGREDERNLWPEYARIIRATWPRWIVGENVAGLLSADVDERTGDHGLFGDILRDLAEMGYAAGWSCYPASAVGAPHQRERVFLIGYRMADTGKQLVRAGTDFSGILGETPAVAHCARQSAVRHPVACASGADVADASGAGAGLQASPHCGQGGERTGTREPTLVRCGDGATGTEGIDTSGRALDDADRLGRDRGPHRATRSDEYPHLEDGQEGAIEPQAAGEGNALADTEQRGQYPGTQRHAGWQARATSSLCGREQRNVADALGVGQREPYHETGAVTPEWDAWPRVGGGSEQSGEYVPHPDRQGLAVGDRGATTRGACATTAGDPEWQAQSGVGRDIAELPAWLDGVIRSRLDAIPWPAPPSPEQYPFEPPRTVTGKVPHRAARLKALGNAVVPAQVYPLFAILVYVDALLRQEMEVA